MKKKISISIILLLLLLLGCYGTSYADVYRDFDYTDLKNFLYNCLISRGNTIEASENYVANITDEQWKQVAQEMNAYDYIIIAYGNNSSIQIRGGQTNFTSGTNKTTYLRNDKSQIINNNNIYSWGKGIFFAGNFAGTINNDTSRTIQIAYSPKNLFYSSYDIFNGNYNGAASGTAPKIAEPPIYMNTTDFFSGKYQPEVQTRLQFYPEATSQNANVYVFEDVPLYTKSNNQNLLIGMLAVPNETTITDVLVERFYYNGQDYVPKVLSQSINNNYITYDLYETDNKQKAYNIYFNKNSLYDNNIYLIEWKDKTKEPYEWTQAVFYIKNNKTSIINGEINPVVTFSGDTNIGDNNIIDNQNDNNDFWKNVYNEMFTLDSGEATQMLDNFITNTNLGEIGTLSGELMALNLLNGEPSDFVISWNNVIIPNLKDNDPKLLIPAGNINFSKLNVTLGNETYTSPKAQDIVDVIGYVRIILGYTIVVLLIANIWETLMHVLGVGTAIYEDNADEKAELYNVDLDTGTVNYTKMHKIPSKKQTWFYHRKG